jgi:magnesium chelatase family protein
VNTKVYSATPLGLDAHLVRVEININLEKDGFLIVGLADRTIGESKRRIQTAIKSAGIIMPHASYITINLAPATLRKEGSLFDLPIAIGVLQSLGKINMSQDFIDETIFIGELSLDGTVNAIRGALPISNDMHKLGKKRLILPMDNAKEAALTRDIEIIGIKDLQEVISYINGHITIQSTHVNIDNYATKTTTLDFGDVKGQKYPKRALQVAAAGNHNMLFSGPPGSGKTMLAKRLPSIMPPLSMSEIIETTKIYSVAGKLQEESLIIDRPFRAPHHSASRATIIGGGHNHAIPGEVSLAHNGVLFLDEFVEFRRDALEALRQPLEDRMIEVNRILFSVQYPAAFLLIAAYNPCPCGYFGDKTKICSCTTTQIQSYKNKLSGPLIDRIDIKVTVHAVTYEESQTKNSIESVTSDSLKNGVMRAIDMQRLRFGKYGVYNSTMTSNEVDMYCKLTDKAQDIVRIAFERLNMSMRSYHKCLKVARTIADIEGSEIIDVKHIQEAIIFRS